jgi:hypothetical protein
MQMILRLIISLELGWSFTLWQENFDAGIFVFFLSHVILMIRKDKLL